MKLLSVLHAASSERKGEGVAISIEQPHTVQITLSF